MWTRLCCWWFGHKIMIKAFTGETYLVSNRLTGNDEKCSLYKWEKQPRCIRCGIDMVAAQPQPQPPTATLSYNYDDVVELGALANLEVMGDWERRQKAAGILRRIGFSAMVHEDQPKSKEKGNDV